MRMILTSLFLILSCSLAHAHFGHVGDLAGHAHWIGTGVIIVGGIVAGVLGTRKSTDSEDEGGEDKQTDTAPEGEPA